MADQTGFLCWEGKSEVDGSDIAMVATYGSANEKTADMIQTWIIRSDMSPTVAVKTGADQSICGDCVARGPSADGKGRFCYVKYFFGPTAVYGKLRRGGYPNLPKRYTFDSPVRGGSYGDPAFVPIDVWHDLLKRSPMGHTMYTHQWHKPEKLAYRHISMASVETRKQFDQAQSAGWRTYRAKQPSDPLYPGEIQCPEQTHGVKCDKCLLCNGKKTPNSKVKSIAVNAIGTKVHLTAFGKTVNKKDK